MLRAREGKDGRLCFKLVGRREIHHVDVVGAVERESGRVSGLSDGLVAALMLGNLGEGSRSKTVFFVFK